MIVVKFISKTAMAEAEGFQQGQERRQPWQKEGAYNGKTHSFTAD